MSTCVIRRVSPGELLVRGYSVFLGYWGDPAANDCITPDGYMRTGDLVEISSDGYARIVGRAKDVVIRGGENLFPREVEGAILPHPDVFDVSVVGVPSEKYGEELCAVVIPAAPGVVVTPEALREFLDGKLARHKHPRAVVMVDSFPLTVSGKVQKHLLRDVACEQLFGSATATGP